MTFPGHQKLHIARVRNLKESNRNEPGHQDENDLDLTIALPKGRKEGVNEFKKKLAAQKSRQKRTALFIVGGIVVVSVVVLWVVMNARS